MAGGSGSIKGRPDGIKDKVWGTMVKYQGIFNWRGLYKEIMEFLKDLDYTDEERFHYFEKQFYQKDSLDPKVGKEAWIWLRSQKIDTPDTSEFYYFFIDVDYTVRFLKDVEVMAGGEKVKMQSGYIEIMIDCGVVLDRGDRWKNHWFLKHFLNFYINRLWYKQYQDKRHRVREDGWKLASMMKQYFELNSYMPQQGEQFVPSHGYKAKENNQ